MAVDHPRVEYGARLADAGRAPYRLWLVDQGYRLDDPRAKLGKQKSLRRYLLPARTVHIEAVPRSTIRFRTRVGIGRCACQDLRVNEVAKFDARDIDLVTREMRVKGEDRKVAVIPPHEVIGPTSGGEDGGGAPSVKTGEHKVVARHHLVSRRGSRVVAKAEGIKKVAVLRR